MSAAGTTGPIADLSYRNYDGPKGVSSMRWWSIAKHGIRLSLKKKGFWLLVMLCALPYLFLAFSLFMQSFTAQIARLAERDLVPKFPAMLGAYYQMGLSPFLLALLIGAGSIAADNRANALQVYLSKPITKKDYLIGKWLYIVILIFSVYFVPMFLVTTYNALASGFISFLKTYPLIYIDLVLLSLMPAVLHASLLVGISAWSKTTWLVGVIYAGLYLFSQIFANVLYAALGFDISSRWGYTIKSFSLPGAINGVGESILGMPARLTTMDIPGMEQPALPYFLPLFAVILTASIVGILMASVRIRAVDVVQG